MGPGFVLLCVCFLVVVLFLAFKEKHTLHIVDVELIFVK